MSEITTNLSLHKYNTTADKESTFKIDLALNENWDKIDLDSKAKGDAIVLLQDRTDDRNGKRKIK